MEFRILSEETRQRYSDYVSFHPEATIYHTLEWEDVLEQTYKYRSIYCLVISENEVTAILPMFFVNTIFGGKRLVSLPFSHHVPILCENDESLVFLQRNLLTLSNEMGCDFLQIRSGSEVFSEPFFAKKEHFDSRLLLSDLSIEALWESSRMSNVRRMIKRANREDITVKEAENLDEYLDFHRLMVKTRHYQGSPCYPKDFFERLFKRLFPKGFCKLYLARFGEDVVAGVLLLIYNGHAIYGYGASQKDRKILNKRPNEALFWKAITDMKGAGIKVFDFGSTPVSHANLLQFKKKWGTDTKELYYMYAGRKHKTGGINRQGLAVRSVSRGLKILPEGLFEKIGSILLRQVG